MARRKKGDGGVAVAELEDELQADTEATEEATVEATEEPETAHEEAEAPKVIIEYRDDPAWEEIHELSDIADENERKWSDLDKKAKQAKKAWEASVEDLQQAIRNHKKPFPLLDNKPKQDDQSLAACPPPFGADEGGTAAMEKADPEPWRSVSVQVLVDDYSLPKRTFDALVDAGLDTIGKIADYTSRGKLLIDIKGISNAGVENIEQAMSDFWAVYLVESTPPDDTPFEPEDEDEDDDSGE